MTIDTQILIQLAAYNAELEGMKVANKQREIEGYSMAYDENDFQRLAQDIRTLLE